MSNQDRVDELVLELLDSGRTPEEICRDCPELLSPGSNYLAARSSGRRGTQLNTARAPTAIARHSFHLTASCRKYPAMKCSACLGAVELPLFI